jgi:phosphoesterase RecJ-like protein
MTDWNEAGALLEGAQQVIILTHVSPDGDAIGSLLGLGHALRSVGKSVTLAVDEGVPDNLRFLPGAAEIQASLNGAQAGLVIAVDCGDESRTGKVGQEARALNVPLINLDHHRTNTLFGDANLVDVATVASAEGVLDWLDHLGIALTPETAQCLLCGLVTDTLCFRTDNVTAVTLSKAQRLMASGAALSFIVQNTVSRMPTAAIKLWAHVMPTVHIEDHVIWAKVTRAARLASGFPEGVDVPDGGLVSLLIQADEAYISCVLREKDDGSVELSIRAVPGFDVSGVAVSLGGGGHKLAAGATLPGPLAEVEAKAIALLREAARAGSPVVG